MRPDVVTLNRKLIYSHCHSTQWGTVEQRVATNPLKSVRYVAWGTTAEHVRGAQGRPHRPAHSCRSCDSADIQDRQITRRRPAAPFELLNGIRSIFKNASSDRHVAERGTSYGCSSSPGVPLNPWRRECIRPSRADGHRHWPPAFRSRPCRRSAIAVLEPDGLATEVDAAGPATREPAVRHGKRGFVHTDLVLTAQDHVVCPMTATGIVLEQLTTSMTSPLACKSPGTT